MSEELGTLGRYELREELGRGGMGVVYVAYDPQVERRVALKVISPQLAADPAFRTRFQREMRIAARLEHPHIVPVYETGTADGSLYMSMRLIPGSDLGKILAQQAPLDPARVARLGRDLGQALDAAHAQGLVHRDVKPGNVLVTGSGDEEHSYLTDFGLTRETASESGLTNTGQWVGTADFVAPEQLEGRTVTARSDVYSLACLLYMCLTSKLPFEGTVARKLFAHLNSELPAVPETIANHDEIDVVLRRGAAKNPDDRYSSAGDLSRALSAAIGGRDVSVPERTVATGLALSGVSTGATELASASAPAAASPPAPPMTPRPTTPTAVQAPGTEPPQPPPSRSATGWLILLGIVALAIGVAIAVVIAQSSKGGSKAHASVRTSTTRRSDTDQSGITHPQIVADPAPEPTTTSKPSYRSYTPSKSGAYTAKLPSGGGWHNLGERKLNPQLFETKLTGPGGATVLIDATPTVKPVFGRAGRRVVSQQTLTSSYGPVKAYEFSGGKPAFCDRGRCLDYQLHSSPTSGVAVLGGPTAAGRAMATTVLATLAPRD